MGLGSFLNSMIVPIVMHYARNHVEPYLYWDLGLECGEQAADRVCPTLRNKFIDSRPENISDSFSKTRGLPSRRLIYLPLFFPLSFSLLQKLSTEIFVVVFDGKVRQRHILWNKNMQRIYSLGEWIDLVKHNSLHFILNQKRSKATTTLIQASLTQITFSNYN